MAATRLDPYVILGVDRTATSAEIRAAYRALVARYHPDRHQGNPLEDLASARMAEINQAYELLSDPARRQAQDRGEGRGDYRGGGGASPVGRAAAPARAGMNRVFKWGLLFLALPLLLRSGVGIVRGLARLLSVLLGELGAFRGTPAALVVVLVAAGVLGFGLLRRRRQRRKLR